MNKDTRYNLKALPAWEPGRGVSGVPVGKVWWSGAGELATPPAIGARVFVAMNGFGTGTVRGYFVEFGWLGVYVQVDNPPAWYVKQLAEDPGPRPGNQERVPMIFGAELAQTKPEGVRL